MKNLWDANVISQAVKDYVTKQKIDTVGEKKKNDIPPPPKTQLNMCRLSHLMTKVFLDIPITLQLITEQGKQTITLSNPDELNTIHKERLYNKNPASNYTNLPLFH